MKKRFLIPAVCVGGFLGLSALGYAIDANDIANCNAGDLAACSEVMESTQDQITNPQWLADKAAADKVAAEKAAKEKAANEKWRAERDAKQAAADAKFKAEGWWQQQPGIYARWCTNTCNNSKVIGSNRYSLLEIWAKDRPAGDIYARVNLIRNGVVIGWTNDTAYLSKGQRGVLTFDSYQFFDEAQLTEFRARG